MNNKNIIITLVVLGVVLVGGYFLLMNNNQMPEQTANESTNNSNLSGSVNLENTENTPVVKSYDVVYTDSGYAPSELKIKVGDTVIFKNQSSGQVWTASAMHPGHTAYSGTSLQQHCPDTTNSSFDECESSKPGESWSFTFTKTGTFGYHNHLSASKFGKIVVE